MGAKERKRRRGMEVFQLLYSKWLLGNA